MFSSLAIWNIRFFIGMFGIILKSLLLIHSFLCFGHAPRRLGLAKVKIYKFLDEMTSEGAFRRENAYNLTRRGRSHPGSDLDVKTQYKWPLIFVRVILDTLCNVQGAQTIVFYDVSGHTWNSSSLGLSSLCPKCRVLRHFLTPMGHRTPRGTLWRAPGLENRLRSSSFFELFSKIA